VEPKRQQNGDPAPRPFQFSLVELFVAVTVFAVCFAMISWWGIAGFKERLGAALSVASFVATIMHYHAAIKENLGW
jgi:hypothetical protein